MTNCLLLQITFSVRASMCLCLKPSDLNHVNMKAFLWELPRKGVFATSTLAMSCSNKNICVCVCPPLPCSNVCS
jgi:hypothetical protein